MSRESRRDRRYRFFNPVSLCTTYADCVCVQSYTVVKANTMRLATTVSCVTGVSPLLNRIFPRGICHKGKIISWRMTDAKGQINVKKKKKKSRHPARYVIRRDADPTLGRRAGVSPRIRTAILNQPADGDGVWHRYENRSNLRGRCAFPVTSSAAHTVYFRTCTSGGGVPRTGMTIDRWKG